MRSLVMLPTYNEAENLPLIVPEILKQGSGIDILVIDDNSPDGTGDLADSLAQNLSEVHVLHRTHKAGLGRAYITGFQFALDRRYDVAIEMDADFSHAPDDLPRLLAAIERCDVVIGSRWVEGGGTEAWSPIRSAISRGGSWYARKMLDLPVHDLTSGFKCFRRRALEALDFSELQANGYGFQVEVNYACARAGMRLTEVPILFRDRVRGRSKMSWRIVAEAALLVWALRLRERHAVPPPLGDVDGGAVPRTRAA